jgi:hypothetical protein
VATLAQPNDEPSDHERGQQERDDHGHADEHIGRTIAVPSSMVMAPKVGRPKERAAQGSEVWIKTGAVMSRGSMAANHVEHEIETFPGSPGRDGQQRRAMKREAEEDWQR